MVNKKIVLVTGSNGLLGQSMVRLFKRKYYIIGCDITRENFNTINPPHEYKPIDLTKREAVLRFVSKKKPDIIINTTKGNQSLKMSSTFLIHRWKNGAFNVFFGSIVLFQRHFTEFKWKL